MNCSTNLFWELWFFTNQKTLSIGFFFFSSYWCEGSALPAVVSKKPESRLRRGGGKAVCHDTQLINHMRRLCNSAVQCKNTLNRTELVLRKSSVTLSHDFLSSGHIFRRNSLYLWRKLQTAFMLASALAQTRGLVEVFSCTVKNFSPNDPRLFFFFLQLTCWNQITDVAANSPTNDNWVYLWCITVKNHILPDSHCLEVAACWFPEKCLFRLVDSLKIPATSAFNMSKHQILRGGRFVAGTEGMKVFT